MTPDQSPSRPRESLEEYVARRLPDADEGQADESQIPAEWRDRPRKRASRHPPNFRVEEAHALEWARVHAGCWKPEIVSYKRLAGGKTAVLIRDKLGSAITLVLDRGDVVDVDEAAAFRRMEEVLE